MRELYRQKEIEFPVQGGDGAVHGATGPARRRRAAATTARACFAGREMRFPAATTSCREEEFRTQSRAEAAGDAAGRRAGKYFPATAQEEIDAKLDEAFEGTQARPRPDDADGAGRVGRSTSSASRSTEADLTGVTQDEARQVLWNAFDDRYRPEMRRWSAACC